MRKYSIAFMAIVVATLFICIPSVFAAGKVVVYSTAPDAVNDWLAAEFEKDTGIKCDMVRLGSGLLMKKVLAEKEDPMCDVAAGLSTLILTGNMSLWQPYKTKEFDAFPEQFRDPNGMWYDVLIHIPVIAYNTNLVSKADIPKKWSDLLAAKWKDKILFANPQSSGSAYSHLTIMLTLFGGNNDEGWRQVERLLKNTKITDESALVYRGVAAGEVSAGITFEYAPIRYKKGGAPIDIVYPADGTIGDGEGMAIIKGAKNLDNARKFMDWHCSRKVAEALLMNYYRRPGRSDIDVPGLVPGMVAYKDIKMLKNYDGAYWAKEKNNVLKREKDLVLRIK